MPDKRSAAPASSRKSGNASPTPPLPTSWMFTSTTCAPRWTATSNPNLFALFTVWDIFWRRSSNAPPEASCSSGRPLVLGVLPAGHLQAAHRNLVGVARFHQLRLSGGGQQFGVGEFNDVAHAG